MDKENITFTEMWSSKTLENYSLKKKIINKLQNIAQFYDSRFQSF